MCDISSFICLFLFLLFIVISYIQFQIMSDK